MKTITIDFGGIRYLMEMHQALQEAFTLPDYYITRMKSWQSQRGSMPF